MGFCCGTEEECCPGAVHAIWGCCPEGKICHGTFNDPRICCPDGIDTICINNDTPSCCDGVCCGPPGEEDCCEKGSEQCCVDNCCPKDYECCMDGTCCNPQQCLRCGPNGCAPMPDCSTCGLPGADPMPRCIGGQCLTPGCTVGPADVMVCPGSSATFEIGYSCINPCPAGEGTVIEVDTELPFNGITSLSFIWTSCATSLGVGLITVAPDAPEGAHVVPIKMTGVGTAECAGIVTVSVDVNSVTITGEQIDQDDPTSTLWLSLPADPEDHPVYGGSEPSTADNVRLTVNAGSGVSTVNWTVEGPGCATWAAPPTGPQAIVWDLGDLLDPVPGLVTFKAEVVFLDGQRKCGSFPSKIGVRTDDVIVIGWIDPTGVTIPALPAPSAAWLGPIVPALGPPVPSPATCNAMMLYFSENGILPTSFGAPGVLTLPERDYILRWMFRYAGNTDPLVVIPGGDFRDETDSHIDEAKIAAFSGTLTNFKLFSRHQIKYTIDAGAFSPWPIILQAVTISGTTMNPCGPFLPAPATFAGQVGPCNGPPSIVPPSLTRVTLINDGSPDAGAIRAFNTLEGNGVTPALFWENIGSAIQFQFDGAPLTQVVLQPYPTYYVFQNGSLAAIAPQSPSPLGNFAPFPYPFGTVPCTGFAGITWGGRCGDAESPADATARIPDFIVP